ncbi:MAG: hypothetical protein OQK58_00775 [Gammaproteobacteria bacterium]|nr:hypothetical protein [Gammaproteobacteria bacterium]
MTAQETQQQKNTQAGFNIQPAAVKKWVNDLPLGSTGESSKQLYHALNQVNKQNNSLDHHIEFLETISPTVALLYPRLSQYFTDVALPLNTKTRNVVHVAHSLLTEILIGYQSIIKSLITKKPFGWKKPFTLALHRTLIYTSQLFCTQHLSYQPYSKGAWRDIFWCYQQADKLKLLHKSYPNYSNNQEKTSIEYEFKRLILLSLLSANALGQKNMQEVHNLMPLWIKHSEILSKEPADKKTCFTLNLLSDVPPYLIGTRSDNTQHTLNHHYFSTFKLQQLLIGYVNKIDDDGAIKIGNNILSKATIQSLLSVWSRNHLRKEVRKTGTGFVDIITGITAIHYVLNQQDQPAYDEVSSNLPDDIIDFESTLTIEPISNIPNNDKLGLSHFLGKSDQAEDIWDKVYQNNVNTTIPEAHWTDSGIHKIFNFSKSILLDYSKDGYRLSVNAQTINSLKHNELVAVREHALAPWALAQVKWLHFSSIGDVQFGLRILTHHVLPVHIRYHANQTLSKPLPCLLGLDRKNLMLFVPTLPTNLKGKKLQLEHHEQHSHIHLKNRLLTTPAFDVYEIHEPHTKEHSTSQNINQPELANGSYNKAESNTQTELTDNIWNNF